MDFVRGQLYRRRDLHDQYGGQRQGGISTPQNHPFLMLFTGETGEQYGYRDGWIDDGLFEYSGEGQYGDMQMVRGNRAILEHAAKGNDLHLFQTEGSGMVRYIGQMVCAGYKNREAPDLAGQLRQAIIFDLVPLEGSAPGEEQAEAPGLSRLWTMPMDQLGQLARDRGARVTDPKVSKRKLYERSEAVRVYVLRRAFDTCEGCSQPAPFTAKDGRPYLEPHHIRRRSDGGPDDPAWVAGVCPNCHRRAHYANDAEEYNRHLKARLGHKD